MYTEKQVATRAVLGLGNLLFSDEGFGVHAMQALQVMVGGDAVEWIDGGVLGMGLLPLVETCSHLLVLDCINGKQPPGTVIELRGEEIPLYAGVKLSEHQLGFQEVLGIAKFRGNFPAHLHLIGVQPDSLALRLEMSATAAAALPEVLRRAQRVLRGW